MLGDNVLVEELLQEDFRPLEALKLVFTGKSDTVISTLKKDIANADSKSRITEIISDIDDYLNATESRIKGDIGRKFVDLFISNFMGGLVGMGASHFIQGENKAKGLLKTFKSQLEAVKSIAVKKKASLK
ncbi:g281 [Yersinia phage phiR1-37]|uniref:hypothetical protein n=1 Tax=Yersinia phage phiR1-37 TaxID=331278 RepID=UPI00022DBDC4|nr:hypothetical protein phiR1-37_gp281 [Yersinia phage phiR1-37]CCE26304.1 g281 [Yersinia phage phiR1-37]